jgi:hypothetical protein
MSERIELLDLNRKERQTAARVVAAVADLRLNWERVEEIFASLGRADWLIVPKSESGLLHGVFAQRPTLLRNERVIATAIVLALNVALEDEASAERVITYLAQRGAALDALFIHEAAAMGEERNNGGRAVL